MSCLNDSHSMVTSSRNALCSKEIRAGGFVRTARRSHVGSLAGWTRVRREDGLLDVYRAFGGCEADMCKATENKAATRRMSR